MGKTKKLEGNSKYFREQRGFYARECHNQICILDGSFERAGRGPDKGQGAQIGDTEGV